MPVKRRGPVLVRPYKNGGFEYDILIEWGEGIEPTRERRISPRETEAATWKWAEAKARELLAAGPPAHASVANASPLFKARSEAWLNSRIADGEEWKPSYLQGLRYAVRGLQKRLAGLTLDDLTKSMIDDLRRELKAMGRHGRPRSDKTVNDLLAVLAMILSDAVKDGVLAGMPEIVMLKRERKQKRRLPPIKADGVRCYTDAQFVELVAAAARISREAHLFTLLAGDQGLRRGELMAIEETDFFLDEDIVRVERAVWLHKGIEHVGPPKSGAGRELPISPALRTLLLGRPKPRKGRRLLPSLVSYAAVRNLMEKIQEAAGFQPTGKAHALRHTFCSRLAMKGVPVRVIQILAGHANIETTERYLHSDRMQEFAAIALLGTPAAAA